MHEFLGSNEIVDWKHPQVLALAKSLDGSDGAVAIASRCFAWVRDEVRHSGDHSDEIVTCTASEVLRHRTGLCYAKSHLLAALLRANGIPAAFAYQRLSMNDEGPPFCLHGLNAVFLPDTGWFRADARGNRAGISTMFTPPVEVLAFRPQRAGESTFAVHWAEPLPVVISALRQARSVAELLGGLPDLATGDAA